jgi:hypothetical protein
MTFNFPPVPAEDKIKGRNDNAYLAAPSTYEQQKAFMEQIKTYAIEMEQKYGVPAAVIGGMAGLESGYGFTRTGFYANNLTGIKYWNQTPGHEDGSWEGVETYQLVGQPDEAWNGSVVVVEDLGDNRKIFDEKKRYDNRYIKFKTRRDCLEYLSTVIFLNSTQGEKYPKNLKPLVDKYQAAIKSGVSVREAALQFACDLGEAGYCHLGCEYYRKAVGKVMEQWNTYAWAILPQQLKDEEVTWLKNFTNEKEETVIVGYIGDKPVTSLTSNLKEEQIKFAQRFSNAKTWRTAKSQEKPPYINPSSQELTLPTAAVERMRTKFAEALKTCRYMEQQCQPTTYPEWEGFPLKECLYQVTDQNGTQKSAKVIMLNPSAEQLARWVVATCMIVKGNADRQYTDQLFERIIGQSGAQFPVAGIVFEDKNGDGVNKIYCFRDGLTVRVKGVRSDDHVPTDEEIEKSLHGEIDKTWTGQYARIQGTTREQYKANGGTVDVGDQNNLKLSWLDVIRELYQAAWGKDRNELMIAWAHSNL